MQSAEPGASFSTSRLRPAIVAPVATVLFVGLVPREFDYSRQLAGMLFANFLCLLCLAVAVRAWILVLRPRAELRLTASGLTMTHGRRALTAPWAAVTQIRIDQRSRRPWVVVWLDPAFAAEVPVPRRPDGSYRVLPIGRGRSKTRRIQHIGRLRAAIMGFGGRYLDPV